MFDDLDKTLKELLEDNGPPVLGADISFKPPDRNYAPGMLTLNLFRYGIRENRVLRDPVPVLDLIGGRYVRRRPPLRVDCDYLVTAWSEKPDARGIEAEGRLLALALVKLGRLPTIPSGKLQGELAGQPFPVPMWVAQADDGKSLSEFWTALGIAPRSSFHLSVTIALDLLAEEPDGWRIASRDARLATRDGSGTAAPVLEVGGVVRGPVGPVEEVTVSADGREPATTDELGRFQLRGLTAGAHTLRVTAPNRPPVDVAITVPSDAPDAYDVQLPP